MKKKKRLSKKMNEPILEIPKYAFGIGNTGAMGFDLASDLLIGTTGNAVTQMIKSLRDGEQERRLITKNTNSVFANGGVTEGVVEVEGDEAFETPDGQVGEFEGPSHENGGIKTSLPGGTKIYSDRLKVNGETMAERKKKREGRQNKLKKLLDETSGDPLLKNAKKRTDEVSELEEQEDLEVQDSMDQMMGAMGELGFTPQMSNGGILSFALGGVTPTTKGAKMKKVKSKGNQSASEINPYEDLTILEATATPQMLQELSGVKEEDPELYKQQLQDNYRQYYENTVPPDNTGNNLALMSDFPQYAKGLDATYSDPNYKGSQVNKDTWNIAKRIYSQAYGETHPESPEAEVNDLQKSFNRSGMVDETDNPDYMLNLMGTQEIFNAFDKSRDAMLSPMEALQRFAYGGKIKKYANGTPPNGIPGLTMPEGTGTTLATFNNNMMNLSTNVLDSVNGYQIPVPEYTSTITPDSPEFDSQPSNKLKSFFQSILGNNPQQNLDLTRGDLMGLAGNMEGKYGPLFATLLNNMETKPNQNFFREYGAEGLGAIEESQGLATMGRDKLLQDLQLQQNTITGRNRNTARGVNTLRALDIAGDITTNQGINQAYNQYAQQMMQILGQKAQMENMQDEKVMTGEYQRDLADRQDLDNFYTNLAKNIANASEFTQKTGRDLNVAQRNQDILAAMNSMSKYGIGWERQPDGTMKIVYLDNNKETTEEKKKRAKLKMQESEITANEKGQTTYTR